MMQRFGISKQVEDLGRQVTAGLCDVFARIEEIYEHNQLKVLDGFRKCAIKEPHFYGTTGYGYGDIGREAIEKLYATVFEAEDALVRHNIVSGTQALSLCLFGVLRPGDKLLAVTGGPYDTLQQVIQGENVGSLRDFQVGYDQVNLNANGGIDYDGIKEKIDSNVHAVLIQRSRGYDWRPTLSTEEIGRVIEFIKGIRKDIVCIVDNCYGEFTALHEPTYYGADLMAGSLIKNPGGGIARGGGYIAGKEKYVTLASYKLTAIGQGKEVGPSFDFNREILMGFFMAPHVTQQALKTAIFCGGVFKQLGFDICPSVDEMREDIIQAIKFGNREMLIDFCQGIQKAAPIDSFVVPEPWEMPGYDCPVIMAAGAFTQGSTTELSADAPIKEPYIAYMQGSLIYECGKVGILIAVQNMVDHGYIKL